MISFRDFAALQGQPYRIRRARMCRPQADRLVIDRGKPVEDALPDYAELDQL